MEEVFEFDTWQFWWEHAFYSRDLTTMKALAGEKCARINCILSQLCAVERCLIEGNGEKLKWLLHTYQTKISSKTNMSYGFTTNTNLKLPALTRACHELWLDGVKLLLSFPGIEISKHCNPLNFLFGFCNQPQLCAKEIAELVLRYESFPRKKYSWRLLKNACVYTDFVAVKMLFKYLDFDLDKNEEKYDFLYVLWYHGQHELLMHLVNEIGYKKTCERNILKLKTDDVANRISRNVRLKCNLIYSVIINTQWRS